MFFLMNIKPFSRLKGRWGSLPQKMIKQEKKQHFSKKGKGINVTQDVTLHSHRDYIDSLHQKIFEWFYFWFHGFMSKWQKHPLNEVKIILQLSRVLQIQGISKSKEQAHGMWKIFKVIHHNFSFQTYCGTWRLKVQWVKGDLLVLRHNGQDSNGDVRHSHNYISDVTFNFYGWKHN